MSSAAAAGAAGPPSFYCQSCRARLVLVRGSSEGGSGNERRSDTGGPQAHPLNLLNDSKIDESFIVLDDRRAGGPAAAGPSSAAGAGSVPGPASSAVGAARSLEESFVVLPGAASVLRPPALAPAQGPAGPAGQSPSSSSSAAAAASSGPSTSRDQQRTSAASGLDAKLDSLASLCELASTVTAVDHPLCLDCAAQLKDEVGKQLEELEAEIAAYSDALGRLEGEVPPALDQAAFEAEMAELKAQTAAAQQEAVQAQQELAAVSQELRAQQAIACDIDALEDRLWHDVNEYQLALGQHLGDRDGLLHRIDRAGQQLLLLKSTNVLNDTFRIWHDGPFGTISGFRLGRTPEAPVEWGEINAAWGQAVLLLHTMAQQCKLNFSAYRLLPMGSHPRVADKRGTYDLFGPVNKLWGGSYDKAMSVFLACLAEFGAFARARDMAEGQANVFEFPFAIEGDKIGNYTIKLSMLNKDSKWTKALKLMLANLKVALQWMIQRDMGGLSASGPPSLPSLTQEGPSHTN